MSFGETLVDPRNFLHVQCIRCMSECRDPTPNGKKQLWARFACDQIRVCVNVDASTELCRGDVLLLVVPKMRSDLCQIFVRVT